MHPYGVNDHRLLVRGIRTEYHEKEELTKERPHHPSGWKSTGGRSLIGLLIVFDTDHIKKGICKDQRKEKEMKHRLITIVGWLFLVTSVGLLLYPEIISFIKQKQSDQIAQELEKNTGRRKNDDSLYQKALRYNEKIREDGQKESERRLELSGSADRPAKRTGYVRIYKNPKDETETSAIPWGHDGKYEKRSNDHGTDFASFR